MNTTLEADYVDAHRWRQQTLPRLVFAALLASMHVWADGPAPLLSPGHPVPWWFEFKFNAKSYPSCGDAPPQTHCLFGSSVRPYSTGKQFVFASSESPHLQQGNACVGSSTDDPLGATFDQIYTGDYYYVVWNDQLKDHPKIAGCSTQCSSPWGHSKGIVAWDDEGHGVVIQVSTPSWPGSGSQHHPRKSDGNTLGCLLDDDVQMSQHFFALQLSELDLRRVLLALQNASVATDIKNVTLVSNGGPDDIQALVKTLGVKSKSATVSNELLSTNVRLIGKPSAVHVPPWQMVSAELDGIPLLVASYWQGSTRINPTKASTKMGCWDAQLMKPGAVDIAKSGVWNSVTYDLTGHAGNNANHAKVGISTSPDASLAIFGDLNQQGNITSKCNSAQNGRGGMFFVIDNADLAADVAGLIGG